jgi:tRNA (uracil-5-)-methyltransferase TRM9
MMNPATVQFLLDLNRRFYTDFSSSFAATRRRIQPGVRHVLDQLPDAPEEMWLDLGCGSSALAVEWLNAGRQSTYLGVDFSASLLLEAQEAVSTLPGHERITFAQADLAAPAWADGLAGKVSGVLSFAVLHHLPSREMRARLASQVANLLPAGGRFYLSVWQFQHSPKLWARRVPWEQVGLRAESLEPGDTLLDWRAETPLPTGLPGLRYVHQFEQNELAELARSTGFEVSESFESDGHGGRLGLYQIWTRLS